jgi:nicotinate (nicotinamide) nucleotide adenylyltransferase
MEFFRRANAPISELGILPGSFNPITIAHLALARSALAYVHEVLFVLPRVLPHKSYTGASFEQRVEMLDRATAGEPRWSIAASDLGLFVQIAEECRTVYGMDTRLSFICGRDAAERIANWDYGRPGVFEEMLGSFDLLVAPRQGVWQHAAVRELSLPADCDAVSATEVRERIARGEPWEHLVPESIHAMARWIYGTTEPRA